MEGFQNGMAPRSQGEGNIKPTTILRQVRSSQVEVVIFWEWSLLFVLFAYGGGGNRFT